MSAPNPRELRHACLMLSVAADWLVNHERFPLEIVHSARVAMNHGDEAQMETALRWAHAELAEPYYDRGEWWTPHTVTAVREVIRDVLDATEVAA